MSNQYRVVMRIGRDFVADRQHYAREAAIKEQQRILKSPTFRAQDIGSVGVRVMHWRTFKNLCDKGAGCTIQRLDENVRRFGRDAAAASPLAQRVDELKHLLEQGDA